jgi:hypothetical protein
VCEERMAWEFEGAIMVLVQFFWGRKWNSLKEESFWVLSGSSWREKQVWIQVKKGEESNSSFFLMVLMTIDLLKLI